MAAGNLMTEREGGRGGPGEGVRGGGGGRGEITPGGSMEQHKADHPGPGQANLYF